MTNPRAVEGDEGPSSSPLSRAVNGELAKIAQVSDPLERALAYGQLLAGLADETLSVTLLRDAALMQVLAPPKPKGDQREGRRRSHRSLARALNISRQRVDQIAARARGGQVSRSKTD